jgi:hypothetical protein
MPWQTAQAQGLIDKIERPEAYIPRPMNVMTTPSSCLCDNSAFSCETIKIESVTVMHRLNTFNAPCSMESTMLKTKKLAQL